MRRPYLFSEKDLRLLIDAYERAIKDEIEKIEKNSILSTSEHDLVAHLLEKYTLVPPALRRDEMFIEAEGEAQIDVSRRFDYGFFDGEGPHFVKGSFVKIAIPFDGDRDLFQFRASTFTAAPPIGEVVGNALQITFQDVNLSSEQIKTQLDQTLNTVDQHLQWLRRDCDGWNTRAQDVVRRRLQERKSRLLQQSSLVSSLGLPLKRRPDAVSTIAVPVARRRPSLGAARPTSTAFRPEPALTESEYDYILNVIDNLAKAIERSPTTFVRMEEEEIRNLILVDLNGHYDGSATGETFNASGKTDILLRAEGRSAFIAECKFWQGSKTFLSAIDQLLGYLTWRDTKTALVIFSKNADFGNVLKQIEATTPAHPNFKRKLKQHSESHYRYLFGQKDDPQRDTYLAVTAFNIPQVVQAPSAAESKRGPRIRAT